MHHIQTQPESPSRPPLVLGLSLAYFVILLDTTVLSVAEPDLIGSLHATIVGVGWATSSYTLTLAAGLLAGGALVDWFGAPRLLRLAVLGFGVLSAACAAAPSLAFLVGGRAVLGLMAAGLVPASLAALSQLYPDSRERAGAIGVWAAVSGSAMACGPVVGGFLVEQFGWRSVFLVNPGICLVVLALCSATRLPNRTARGPRPEPLPHVVLGLILAAGTLAVTEGGERHLAAAAAAAGAVLVLVLALRFLNRRALQPLVPRALTAERAVWLACGWGAAVNYALSTVLFVVPLSGAGSPTKVGLTLLPMTLVMTLNPVLTARLTARFGALRLIRAGIGALVVGQLGLALTLGGAHDHAVVGRSLALLSCGFGVSWALPSLVAYVVGHAPPTAVGAVGGVLNASRQLGATLGAAVTASALSLTHGHPATAIVVAAAVCATCGVASAQLPRVPQLLGGGR
jgi:DHA2 family methylenomycin A resistance protein-like MFS transporter